jgi:RNA polymerase sigma factor (sigma-70 family)
MASAFSMSVELRKVPLLERSIIPLNPSRASMEDSDARRLTGRIARGEESAFQELYDGYHQRLFRLAIVSSKGDEPLAHEVVHSTMLIAAAKLRPVETEEHLWNWLARVAHQQLSKHWRRKGTEPTLVGLEELSEIAEKGEADRILEESLETALHALDQDDRQIIEWYYFESLSHKQIAERLQATPKAVSSRLERARAKLKLALAQKLADEF